jgi:hypothetical protein
MWKLELSLSTECFLKYFSFCWMNISSLVINKSGCKISSGSSIVKASGYLKVEKYIVGEWKFTVVIINLFLIFDSLEILTYQCLPRKSKMVFKG